ncbi:glutamyl-tRNA reductase [Actinomadura pelletieri DSM 43383]|uniref:Glutamyl-tRNA reductase n=1 Tax=Actinomadura pelletieri DSM 43383 TaxID=1120940 RepID=A0A495QFW6_9ACTN|nr:glutamyl-tRNA reductase [Actinomadura pelletieri]RKS70806.1 glutamyl-tRNA reductase [Actinomadura pelletieri DSM 43383]
MSILVVGLSHRSAPVAVLERAAVAGDDLVKLLHAVHASPNVAEAAIVSTCNRVEIYAVVDRFHGGVSAISELLALHSGVPTDDLTRHLYVHYEERAVQHVFAVACGLESMVVGEGQILGQIRQAFRVAQEEGTLGRDLHDVLQQSLRVGKRAHHETGIDKAGASLVGVGLDVATRYLGPLEGVRALVVGAGSMSSLAAATLSRAGAREVVVANRTHERAVRLAESLDAPSRAIELDVVHSAIPDADLVVSCTGATGLVLTSQRLREQGVGADGRRRFFLDLALPHDIDRSVRDLTGVGLAGLDDLRTAEEAAHAIGPAAVEAVRRIVCDEVEAYVGAARAAAVAPTVVALRSMAADVVEAELSRLTGRLPEMDVRARREIEQTVRRVVDKLLHAPTVRVKELAAAPGGDSYADALRELFDLDPKAPEAVARADMREEPAAGWSAPSYTSVDCAEADCVSTMPSGPDGQGVTTVQDVNAQAANVRAVSTRESVAGREGDEG